MRSARPPHAAHVFFCLHTREDGSKSCGHSPVTAQMAEELKARFKAQGLPVRISRSACLGPCAQGPNAMAYFKDGSEAGCGVWFQELEALDTDAVEAEIRDQIRARTQKPPASE